MGTFGFVDLRFSPNPGQRPGSPRLSRSLLQLRTWGHVEVSEAPEAQERVLRRVLEHQNERGPEAGKISCTAKTLRRWVRRAERDQGKRPGATAGELERIRQLEREARELRQANGILRKASAHFARRSSTAGSAMTAFVDEHRAAYGVEPICKVPPIAPSTHYPPRPDRPVRNCTRTTGDRTRHFAP